MENEKNIVKYFGKSALISIYNTKYKGEKINI